MHAAIRQCVRTRRAMPLQQSRQIATLHTLPYSQLHAFAERTQLSKTHVFLIVTCHGMLRTFVTTVSGALNTVAVARAFDRKRH